MRLHLRSFSTASGVASRGEQRQSIRQRPVCRPGFGFRKDFIERDLFKRQDRQDLEYRVEWGLDSELLANRRDQHVERDGHPELRLDGILRGAEETLDPQVLFDPLEKQLYLPAALV